MLLSPAMRERRNGSTDRGMSVSSAPWMVGWYVYTQDIHDGIEIVYELPLLPNNAASGTFLYNLGTVLRIVLSLRPSPGGDWANT